MVIGRDQFVYCAAGEYDVVDGKKRYIPSVVFDGKKGHNPLRGSSPDQMPYYWGDTMEECQKICDKQNEEMGIDRETALKIIGQSMR